MSRTKELRVLLRATYPPPYGGIASHIVSLLPRLNTYGVSDVAVLQFGNKNETLKVDGATVYRFALKTQTWRVLLPWNWRLSLAVRRSLRDAKLSRSEMGIEVLKGIMADTVARRHKSNVVSFYQSNGSLELLGCRSVWKRNKGVVLTVFGDIYDAPDFIKPRVPTFKALLEAPDAVLASSVHCARGFQTVDIDRPIEAVYYGVDLARFEDPALRQAGREQLDIDADAPVALFFGRFDRDMGLDQIVGLVPSLVERVPSVKVVLAGAKGPLSESALELRAAYPNNVIVMNDVAFAKQPALYAASDIVLTPSRAQHACMGMTIKEAMAASRPVIGSDSGGIPEAIIHGDTGLMIPLGADGNVDRVAYENAIVSLLADQATRQRMGSSARNRAEQLFSEETTAKRIAEVFVGAMPRA